MRCLACNKLMSEFDTSRKALSGAYIDLCGRCYRTVEKDLPSYGNYSLMHEDDDMSEETLDNEEDTLYNNYVDDEDNIEDNH